MGPLEVSKPWITAGLIGVSRFLERLYAISEKPLSDINAGGDNTNAGKADGDKNAGDVEMQKLLHRTIKKVTDDTATINFNTAISAMMIYSNELVKLKELPRQLWEPFVIMLSAYAPHLGEEFWEKLGNKKSVSSSLWPVYDEALVKFDEVTIVVQINGKIRDKFTAAAGTEKDELEKTAFTLPGVIKWTEGLTVIKIVTVLDKLVNIVAK